MRLLITYNKNINNLDNNKLKLIKNFTLFCITKLNITDEEINLVLLPKISMYDITTGAYDRLNNVYCRVEDRALPDIFRTISHEFAHYNQKLNNKFGLNDAVQDIGGIIEDEANAVSGRMVKMFVLEYNCNYIYKL